MAPFYIGRKSYLNDVFGMKDESQMLGTFLEFIRKSRAIDGLFSENCKVQTRQILFANKTSMTCKVSHKCSRLKSSRSRVND